LCLRDGHGARRVDKQAQAVFNAQPGFSAVPAMCQSQTRSQLPWWSRQRRVLGAEFRLSLKRMFGFGTDSVTC
jgi:hypothetical protein